MAYISLRGVYGTEVDIRVYDLTQPIEDYYAFRFWAAGWNGGSKDTTYASDLTTTSTGGGYYRTSDITLTNFSSGTYTLYGEVRPRVNTTWYSLGSVTVTVEGGNPPAKPSPFVYDYSYTWIEFEWDSSGYIEGYEFQFRRGTTVIETGRLSVGYNYKRFTGLSPGTSYNFRVRAYNDYGTSAWSSYLYRTTQTLSYPDFSIFDRNSNTIVISIYEESNVERYRVYVDGVYDGYLTSTSNTGYKAYIIDGLTMGRSYSVRVSTVVDGVESSLSPAQIMETEYLFPTTYLDSVGNNTAKISWTSIPGATRYYVYLNGVSQGYVTSTTFTFTNLTPLTTYGFYVEAYNGYVYSNTGLVLAQFTTTDKVRPNNWTWEYTIAAGQPFYSQSGSSVFIMRASHWNEFTARINQFRVYKGLANYSFTTALTSHTPTQIKNCINQAITAINAMGFSQAQVSSGGDVAASTFITMRNNLNSIT